MAGEGKLAYFVSLTDADGAPHTFGPSDDVPAWAVKAITNPSAWVGGEAPEVEDDEKPPYLKWRKADLEDEVDRRNKDRDDVIEVGGNGTVADLAAALDADDAAQG